MMHVEYEKLNYRGVWNHLVCSVQAIIMDFCVEGDTSTGLDLVIYSSLSEDTIPKKLQLHCNQFRYPSKSIPSPPLMCIKFLLSGTTTDIISLFGYVIYCSDDTYRQHCASDEKINDMTKQANFSNNSATDWYFTRLVVEMMVNTMVLVV